METAGSSVQKEQTPPSQPSLSSEQQTFVNRWSVGGLLGLWYFLAGRLYIEALLMLIPIYNIYLGIKAIGRGRRMVWSSGKWSDFQSYRKRQKILDWVAIVLILGTIASIGLSIFFVSRVTSPVAQAAETFLTQLASNKIEEAYNGTDQEFKDIGNVEQFKSFVSKNSNLTQMKTVAFSSKNISIKDGVNRATLQGTITTKENQQQPIEVTLVQENGVWKVTGMSLTPTPEQPAAGG